MAHRVRVSALLFLFLLSSTLSSSQAPVGRNDGRVQMLLPNSGYSGGLITGVVLGPDDQPVANAPVTITGGYPATLSGEVIGDEPPKQEPQGQTQEYHGQPLRTPQDCARLLQQAQELLLRNPGNEPIPVGMLVPAIQKIRNAHLKKDATQPGGVAAPQPTGPAAPGSSHGNEKWIRGNSGGLYTDAEGRFAFCATNDAEQVQVQVSEITVTKSSDRSVPVSIPLRKAGDPAACDPQPPSYFSPDSRLDLCGSATRGTIAQGGREWKLASARAFSPNGDRAVTTFKTPRDLGPGTAELSFLDGQGQKQSSRHRMFAIVDRSIDRNRLHSHQGADFQFQIAFNFQPAGGMPIKWSVNSMDSSAPGEPKLKAGVCVKVATTGPIVLTQPPPAQLQVRDDGRATVKGKIRATQVAPGSAVPFGITLRVNECAASAAAGSNPLFLASGDVNDSNPLYTRLRGGLQPSVRQWVTEQARRQAQQPDRTALESAIHSRFKNLGDMEGADIAALAFIVMMEAAQGAHDDLKALAEKMEALNQKKQELRDRQSALEEERANRGKADSAQKCLTRGCALLARSLGFTRTLTYADLDTASDSIQKELDSLGDDSDMLGKKLQELMDRKSKAQQLASELLHKVSDSSSSIVSNLK